MAIAPTDGCGWQSELSRHTAPIVQPPHSGPTDSQQGEPASENAGRKRTFSVYIFSCYIIVPYVEKRNNQNVYATIWEII